MLSSVNVHAQFPAFNFSKISVELGLSNRVVTSIYQDETGFIWAGSFDGLNRLDGYRIKQFFYQPNSSVGLSSNAIHQITGKQKMWVSTESGFTFLNNQQQFEKIQTKGLLNNVFKANLFEDDKNLWICCKGSLYLWVDGTIKNVPLKFPTTLISCKQRSINSVNNITKDAAGNYWGWKDDFLFKLNLKDGKLLQTFSIKTHVHDGIVFAKQDDIDKHIIWVGTWANGLFKFNTLTNTSELIALDNDVIHDLKSYTDVFGKRWLIAATNKGFSLINPSTYATQQYNIGETFTILIDKQNNLWLGTANGILYVEPQKQWFNTMQLSTSIAAFKNETQLYIPNTISTINDKHFVSLIHGKGMAVYDNNWHLEKHIATLLPSINSNAFAILSNATTYKNAYWFCSDSGMVKCNYNYAVEKIVCSPTIKNVARTSYNKIRKLLQVNDSLVLLKSASAIHVFDLKSERFVKTFTHINGNNESLPEIYFSDIAFLQNNCFITTDDGLLQLDYTTGKWQRVQQSFANTRMECIAARDSLVWVGTQTGLSCFNIINKTVKNYYRKDGLSSDNILRICTDNKQRVWIATTNGLTCFEKNINYFTRIYKEHGLPENFLEGLLYADDNGKIVVGSINTITWFYADRVLQKNQAIKAVITEIFNNNEAINAIFKNNEKHITVAYNSNNISLHFALLNYNNTSLNKYYYLLEGADNNWQESENGFLQFSNLKSGKYKLYVSALASKNRLVDVLYITVQSPFYETWWFISMLLLVFALVLFFIGRLKAKALKEKLLLEKNYSQQLKEAEMQTLRSQMNPHFIFNTLNAINSFIVENKTEQASDYLVTFSKLVRNILENSRHENISLDKEITALELYLQLEQVRLEKSFDYHIAIDENIDTISLRVPPLIIQPFVENAIWHGLRNKTEKGNVWISIVQQNEQVVVITIADDGIGREAASKLKASQINHKSYGIEITKTRVALLHQENKIEMTDRIVDGVIEGTIVKMYLNTI